MKVGKFLRLIQKKIDFFPTATLFRILINFFNKTYLFYRRMNIN